MARKKKVAVPRWNVTHSMSGECVLMLEQEANAAGISEDEVISRAVEIYCQSNKKARDRLNKAPRE